MNVVNAAPQLVQGYLQRLGRALRPLPEPDRAAIMVEIESHIAERLREASGDGESALASLGPPDVLAAAYLQDYGLSRAIYRSAPGPLLAAVLARATRSLTAFAAGVVAVILYALGLSFAAVAVMKPIAPGIVGLWTGVGGPEFGVVAAAPAGSAERLGLWIMPVAALAAVLCYLAATTLTRLCGRRLLRSPSGPALAQPSL